MPASSFSCWQNPSRTTTCVKTKNCVTKVFPGRVLREVQPAAKKMTFDRANPFAAILTVGMMVEHIGLGTAGRRIEGAVKACLEAEECTVDVGGRLGTAATGDAVVRRLDG